MDVINELKECLALQQQIAAKRLELKKRFKAIIEGERERNPKNTEITALIDGTCYVMLRADEYTDPFEAMDHRRLLGGSYDYRLVPTPNLYIQPKDIRTS
jgi:hypothetical protein